MASLTIFFQVPTKPSTRDRDDLPTSSPSSIPTSSPVLPSNSPSFSPTSSPTTSPSTKPSLSPSLSPSNSPVAYYWNQTAKFIASDGGVGHNFGQSVSLSGNIAIVGSYLGVGHNVLTGAAYVLEKDESTGHWNETAKLVASDGLAFDLFGQSVSVSGNTAIVGAHFAGVNRDGTGAVYVFEKDSVSGLWGETAILTASDGILGDNFGLSVSISENIAIIGSLSGSAYIFEKNNSTGSWEEKAKLKGSDGVSNERFGYSVSVSENIAIVGAYLSDSAYVFEKVGVAGTWNETAKLTASDGTAGENFGWGVSISGNIVIVGSSEDGDSGTGTGSAYIFEKDGSTGFWNETAKLTNSDEAVTDLFGYSVSVSGNIVIVGAILDDGNEENSGSAFVFEKDASTGYWNETAILTASDGATNDFFGWSVSVSGDEAIVSSFFDADNGDGSGSAYAFERFKK